MTMLDTGTYGAKVQSWHKSNPRDLLKTLIEENPGAKKETLMRVFRDSVHEHQEYLDSIIEYWFSNNWHSLVPYSTPPEERMRKAEKVEKFKTAIAAKIEEKAKMLLLDMILPNEKPLRNCTGKECAALAPKVGKWLTAIAAKIKPSQKVGDAMSEKQVRSLYES